MPRTQLLTEVSVTLRDIPSSVVQFRIRYGRWIEAPETLICTGLASTQGKYILKFESEEDLCTTVSIVLNSNSGTFSPVFVNILLQVETNPV